MKKLTTTLFLALLFSAALSLAFSPVPVSAQNLSPTERSALLEQIVVLQQRLLELMAELQARGGTVPATPTVPVGALRVCGEVEINWEAVEGATRYNIKRNGETIATNLRSTSFTDTNLERGRSYTYQVIPTNRSGAGDPAFTRLVYVNPACPAAPTNLQAQTGSCGGRVGLSWSTSPGATRYDIYRQGNLVHRTTATSWTDTNLALNRTFNYTVRAINSFGRSGESQSVRGRSSAICPPSAPSEVSVERSDFLQEGEFNVRRLDRSVPNITAGRTGEILRLAVTAEDSDILISRLDLVFSHDPVWYLDRLDVRRGTRDTAVNRLASVDIQRSVVSTLGSSRYRVRVQDLSLVVPAGTTRNIYVFASTLERSLRPIPSEISVQVPVNGLRGTDEVGLSYQRPSSGADISADFSHRFRLRQ